MNQEPLHINAAPGDPNTFWQGASGLWYRTKKQAEQDDAGQAVDPNAYAVEKSFMAKHGKKLIVAAAVLAVAITIFLLMKKGILTVKFKH